MYSGVAFCTEGAISFTAEANSGTVALTLYSQGPLVYSGLNFCTEGANSFTADSISVFRGGDLERKVGARLGQTTLCPPRMGRPRST